MISNSFKPCASSDALKRFSCSRPFFAREVNQRIFSMGPLDEPLGRPQLELRQVFAREEAGDVRGAEDHPVV